MNLYRLLILSAPVDWLVRKAIAIRVEQIRLLGIFNDAEATSQPDQSPLPSQGCRLQR